MEVYLGTTSLHSPEVCLVNMNYIIQHEITYCSARIRWNGLTDQTCELVNKIPFPEFRKITLFLAVIQRTVLLKHQGSWCPLPALPHPLSPLCKLGRC